MHPLDKCFECGVPIPRPLPNRLPWCGVCEAEFSERYPRMVALDKRLRTMGVMPRKNTKRELRFRAIREMRVRASNDNGWKFGAPKPYSFY